jgi:hypothetical protein
MRTLTRFCGVGLLGATLMIPVTLAPTALRAQDDRRENERRDNERRDNRRYHDAKHNDDHEWNEHENQAYRMWVQERHRKYEDFDRLKDRDRESYWDWRHNHSDAVLKLDIR